jgi:hypothetical protein
VNDAPLCGSEGINLFEWAGEWVSQRDKKHREPFGFRKAKLIFRGLKGWIPVKKWGMSWFGFPVDRRGGPSYAVPLFLV